MVQKETVMSINASSATAKPAIAVCLECVSTCNFQQCKEERGPVVIKGELLGVSKIFIWLLGVSRGSKERGYLPFEYYCGAGWQRVRTGYINGWRLCGDQLSS
ncbi:hypothetical protein KM043_005641 [Ampulex compressa]|nr:hypothetical protein KM043_005641 [Ampulex compressa]